VPQGYQLWRGECAFQNEYRICVESGSLQCGTDPASSMPISIIAARVCPVSQ
jgi:hypothetical protein